VTVLVTNTSNRTEREVRGGVCIIKAARLAALASTPLSTAMLVEAVEIEPDLVNLHMPYPPGDVIARAVRGAPALVLTYHSDVVRQQQLLRVYRPLLERTLASARRIIVTSRPYLQSSPFLRPHAARCRVVPLSVDPARFATFDTPEIARLRAGLRGPIILSVGVLRYYKGLHILIEALRELDATLLVVGEGPERSRLETLARDLDLADRVHFAGRVADEELPSYYQAGDIFVLPSHLRAEAFGIVLLEAMAAGLPLVTTEIGTGTSEVNQHGRTGFVVPPGDSRALARALKVLAADQALREHFGQNGRRRVLDEYTPTIMVERTGAVYREALSALV
jgi:rhamnosyl/mannosyltransferase